MECRRAVRRRGVEDVDAEAFPYATQRNLVGTVRDVVVESNTNAVLRRQVVPSVSRDAILA